MLRNKAVKLIKLMENRRSRESRDHAAGKSAMPATIRAAHVTAFSLIHLLHASLPYRCLNCSSNCLGPINQYGQFDGPEEVRSQWLRIAGIFLINGLSAGSDADVIATSISNDVKRRVKTHWLLLCQSKLSSDWLHVHMLPFLRNKCNREYAANGC